MRGTDADPDMHIPYECYDDQVPALFLRDCMSVMREDEPAGANPATWGVLPEDAVSETEDDELELRPVMDFHTGEVLQEGRPGWRPCRVEGERGLDAEVE